MSEKNEKIIAYEEQKVSAVLQNVYKLVEENNSTIVEGAFVTCNQALDLPNAQIRSYVGVKNYNTRNGAAGLRESDIKLYPKAFGVCKVLSEACEPEIEGKKWQECDQTHRINGEASVTLNSYMVCLKGGIIAPWTNGQRIEELMEKEQELMEKEQELSIIDSVSDEYFRFLIAYEGSEDSWKYAQDLGDGCITIAFGVVLKDKEGNIMDEELYAKWVTNNETNKAMTWEEACEVTQEYMKDFMTELNKTAETKGWNLTQNRYDAIFDLYWNGPSNSLGFTATELLATGDLDDATVLAELKKEILETAHGMEKNKAGVLENMWLKNLVERRLDTILIAQNGNEAYTRHEVYDAKEWNESAKEILLDYGLDEEKIDRYNFQEL